MDYFIHLMSISGIFIILSLSLNLINGTCGQFSLGHAGFWATGAYISGAYAVYFAPSFLPNEVNLLIGIILAMGGSILLGLLVGVPCLRLRGDYLAIATLGLGEIVRIAIINIDSIGGPRGFTDIPKWSNIGLIYLAVALTFILLRNLTYSSIGRAITSIREDEIAAESLGINLFKYKILSFTIGPALAGMAGALFAHTVQFLHPNGFSFMWSVIILLMMILGGSGSLIGPIVGAVILTFLPEMLRLIHESMAEWRMVIYSTLLILMMILRPEGIFGKYDPQKGIFRYIFPQNK